MQETASKVALNDPHLLVFMPLCNSLSLNVAAISDLLLEKRMQQR